MKITDNFCYKRKLPCTTTKPTLFIVSKDEWDKDTGMYCGIAKGNSRAKVVLTSKKLSP